MTDLLVECWCRAKTRRVPVDVIRRCETFECGPTCRAIYDRIHSPRATAN